MTFKVGDKVVCINDTNMTNFFQMNDRFVILDVSKDLIKIHPSRTEAWFLPRRFLLLEEQKEPQSTETKEKENSDGVKFDIQKLSLELLAPSYWQMTNSLHSLQISKWYVYGNKFPDRLPYDVIPVLEHGQTKYGSFNWLKGMAWGRLVGAFHRHCNKLENGLWVPRDLDELDESGWAHGAHAECNRLFLLEYEEQRQQGHLIGTNDCPWANK